MKRTVPIPVAKLLADKKSESVWYASSYRIDKEGLFYMACDCDCDMNRYREIKINMRRMDNDS